MPRSLVIGLSGFVAVGKTTFCRIAQDKYDAQVIEFRQFFQSELEQRRLAPTRENLDLVANDWYARFGRPRLFELLWERARERALVVIDSIRTTAAAEWFSTRSSHSYTSVLIVAPLDERVRRLRARGAAEMSDLSIAGYDDMMRHGGLESVASGAQYVLDNGRSLVEYEVAVRALLDILCGHRSRHQ